MVGQYTTSGQEQPSPTSRGARQDADCRRLVCRWPGLAAADRLAWVWLHDHRRGDSLPAIVVVIAAELGMGCGASERSAQRWLQALEAAGLLSVRDRRGGGVVEYVLHDPAEIAVAGPVVARGQVGRPLLAGLDADAPSLRAGPPATSMTTSMTTSVSSSLSHDIRDDMRDDMRDDIRVAAQPDPNGEPAAETPRAGERAHTVQTVHTDDDDGMSICRQTGDRARHVLAQLWPRGRGPIRDIRDHRLVFRMAWLGGQIDHADWVVRLVEATAEAKPKKPLAYLQSLGPSFAPAGVDWGRLLNQIPVPRWALADPRKWPGAPAPAARPAAPEATAPAGELERDISGGRASIAAAAAAVRRAGRRPEAGGEDAQ